MNRSLSVLSLIALLVYIPAHAAERTLVAEGDYVAVGDAKKPLAHWKIWHIENGGYEVVETLAGMKNITQVFAFDEQFLPSGFSLTISPPLPPPSAPKPPFAMYPTITSCRYNAADLSCDNESNGKKRAISVPVKRPFVLEPGEFYALDQIWFATEIVRLLESKNFVGDAVNVYVLENSKIRAGKPIQLTPTGEETATVMGGPQSVMKYELWIGGEPGEWVLSRLSLLQVTSRGLVAGIRGKKDPTSGFAIANYKEYRPWLPSLK